MFLALELKHGQKIRFEVKDVIHIEEEDGITVLFQAKHSVLKNADGSTQNLTTLDSDLWKTLSNWTDILKAEKGNSDFITKNSFYLVTNKSESINEFINSFSLFKADNDFDQVLVILKELENKTTDKTLKAFIQNVV
jgi:hypothetical protein